MSKNILEASLENVKHVVLLGHIHPDGDCIGTTLGLLNYLRENYSQIEAELFLDHPADKFSYMNCFDKIQTEFVEGRSYDLCITMDASDKERLGEYGAYFDTAGKTLCIDHHRTNLGFADKNHIVATASSCSEVLYELLDDAKISRETAECLYTGIVHDTGVFKYNSTTRRTMEVAGALMEKGVNTAGIIDDSFYRKTYAQNQILGRAMLNSTLILDGRCIFSVISQKEMDFYGVDTNDLDGIIDQLRVTEGVECAIFIYEKAPDEYKVSLRSNDYVDVSKLAGYFGGGGHIHAAGCTMQGRPRDVINNLTGYIEKQMQDR